MAALVTSGLGGEEARLRLGGVVRRIKGSPEQITVLLQDRGGAPLVDVEELLRIAT